jgi:RHS repeat-associated protein
MNYILAYVPRVSGLTTATSVVNASLDKTQVQTSIQYFDGLDRPIQTIQVKGSPNGRDIVQPYIYDSQGRDSVKYLPYAVSGSTSSDGGYKTDALTAGAGVAYFYNPTGSGTSGTQQSNGIVINPNPYSQTVFEQSALNRVTEQGAPGTPWQPVPNSTAGHTVKMSYTLNNDTSFTSDSVKGRKAAWYNANINADGSRTLVANGYYPANTLTVTVTKDENWTSGRAGTTEEYKDTEGHILLKRQYNYTTSLQVLSTYYVYDDMDKLAFVLTPMAAGDAGTTISQTTLNNLCYQYRYDERGRQTQKKLPGKGWEYTVYNYIDEPVASQDSLQRTANNWIITKYDGVGRPIQTGIWNTAISRSSLQATLTGITTNLWEAPVATGNGYTNAAWPATSVTATLTLNYYDSYANIPNLPATYSAPAGASVQTRGLPTARKTAVLNTPTDQLWSVLYYDDLGRTMKTYAQHYLGGTANTSNYDAITTTYNFTNQLASTTRQNFTTGSTTTPMLTATNTYMYDHMGRKQKTWEQLTYGNNLPTGNTLISQADYNELGQVQNKHLHSTDSTSFQQNIAYTYNERGWLLTSSAPLFAMQLYYNTGSRKAYNGNILYQYWGTPGSLTKNYSYVYDKLNRFLYNTSVTGNNETGVSYDLNGNITALHRSGYANDNLTYTYMNSGLSNQIASIADVAGTNSGLANGTTTFGNYDGNGNMLSVSNAGNAAKNKTFSYNLLNLPQTVTANTSATTTTTLTYTYDAAGNKLRRKSTGLSNTTDYISGIQYDGQTTPAFNFIQTEEGEAVYLPSTGGFEYEYYLGDNLGNTRVTFGTKSGTANIYQTDDYYPFGMEVNSYTLLPKNEYLYNKKELQEELGQYDYGARFYDPVIGRWNVIDPDIENGQETATPYGYVWDDPIKYTDPDGRAPDITIEGENNSSVTIQTSLVNTTVHVGIDLHGNHTINGERALQTGLDLVSLVDPTGLSSLASGGISLKNGEYLDALTSFAGALPLVGKLADGIKVEKDVAAIEKLAADGEKVAADGEKVATKVEGPYKRPSNATTAEQRASVQGKPCAKCGATDGKRIAGHKKALVEEHYETGTIDKKRMRDVNSVQPECETCSTREGAEKSRYSKKQKKAHGFD